MSDTKIDWCDSCGYNKEVRMVKREWLGSFWWCRDCEELFPIPPKGEGAGAYVDTIVEGLKHWYNTNPDKGAYAEHEVLYQIKAVIDTWYNANERTDNARDFLEEE